MEYKLVQKYVHLIIVISIIREEILEDYTIWCNPNSWCNYHSAFNVSFLETESTCPSGLFPHCSLQTEMNGT